MKNNMPEGITGLDLIKRAGKPDLEFWLSKAQNFDFAHVRLTTYMKGEWVALKPN